MWSMYEHVEGKEIKWNAIWINVVAGIRTEATFEIGGALHMKLRVSLNRRGKAKQCYPIKLPCMCQCGPVHVRYYTNTMQTQLTHSNGSKQFWKWNLITFIVFITCLRTFVFRNLNQAHQWIDLSTHNTNPGMI